MARSEISEQAAAPDSDHGNSSNRKQIYWRTCESVDASKIYGFDNELMLVRNLFQRQEDKDRFKAIAIVGVRGIGKSTICRKILETSDVKMDYLPRIWISVSRNFTNEADRDVALVQDILLRLGFEEDKLASISRNRNIKALLYVLHLQLTGKRYLIVLDGVNKSEKWFTEDDVNKSEKLFIEDLNSHPRNPNASHLTDGLPKNGGGRVIVTSRSSAVAKRMVGEKNMHELLPFSDPKNFWKIYETEVNNSGSDEIGSDDVDEVKQELLEKCMGLPLVAKMLSKIEIPDAGQRAKP